MQSYSQSEYLNYAACMHYSESRAREMLLMFWDIPKRERKEEGKEESKKEKEKKKKKKREN